MPCHAIKWRVVRVFESPRRWRLPAWKFWIDASQEKPWHAMDSILTQSTSYFFDLLLHYFTMHKCTCSSSFINYPCEDLLAIRYLLSCNGLPEISCHRSVHLVGDPLEGIFHARDHDSHRLYDWGDGTTGSCGGSSSSNNSDNSRSAATTAAAATTTTTTTATTTTTRNEKKWEEGKGFL